MTDLITSPDSKDTSLLTAPIKETVVAEPSEKNVSAQGAIIAGMGEDLVETFAGLQGLDEQERRFALSSMTDATFEGAKETAQSVASSLILSPNFTDEQKQDIVRSLSGMEKPSSMVMAMETMASQDSGNEDPVSEGQRLSLAEVSSGIEKRLQHKQKLMNSHFLSTDDATAEKVFDFLEMLVPLTDNVMTAQMVAEFRALGAPGIAKAATLIGSAKADLRDVYLGLSSEDQMRMETALAGILSDSSGIIFTNDNEMLKKDMFMQVTDGTYYEDWEIGLDNVIGVLDLVGLGFLLKPAKGSKALSKLKARAMRSTVQPTSPAEVAKNVNPSEARKLQQMAEEDVLGEIAKVTHGASREDVIAGSRAPQVRMEDGSLESKPAQLDDEIANFLESGNLEFSPEEIASAQRKAEAKLQNVAGLTNRTNMATYKPAVHSDTGSTYYQNVYGPGDSSYTSPQEGIDSVMFHLRDYGIEESDLTVLRFNGDEYVPTTVAEAKAKDELKREAVAKGVELTEEFSKENLLDNYLIQVNFEHKFDRYDVDIEKTDVKRNFLDHIPFFNRGKKGSSSVMRSFLDIHSMVDSRITLGANVAVEKSSAIEAAIVKNAEQFVKPFQKLPADRQELVMDIIKKQNSENRLIRPSTLKTNEVEILDAWKQTWDQLWHLENRDLVKSLKAQGYQKFVDEAEGGSDMFARPVGRNAAGKSTVGKVYDPDLGIVRHIKPSELTELYKSEGTLAELKDLGRFNGEEFGYVLVRNQQNKSHLRAISDTERVLSYREGYYAVRYKDPHIVVKEVTDADGNVSSTAIKTAGSVPDAKQLVNELTRANREQGVVYRFRDNRDRSVGQMETDNWQIHMTNGRTAQKFRGERLGTDVEAEKGGSVIGNVEGPAEALLNSVRSISRRTSMRDYIENYKVRFMSEFDEILPVDPNTQQKRFPKDADDLSKSISSSSKVLADARTHLEYINYLEHGYRSTLDDSWKAMLGGIADGLGHAGLGKMEKGVRTVLEEVPDASGWFRGRAFEAYLALNPLRQFVVQGHQATLLAANFPGYVLKQGLAKDVIAIHAAMILGEKVKDAKALQKLVGKNGDEILSLAEEYRKTGFDGTIDRNNLVEKGLDNIIDTGNFKTVKEAHQAVVGGLRKVGFDAGERINIMSSWLAHRNKVVTEQGADALKGQRTRDEIVAKARNYTFNMNAAGEMPYNKNSLSLLFQFMQVPHKAMTQMVNRALTREERARIAAYNIIMMPMPVGLGYSIIADWEIEDEDVRDVIANGVEGYLFNKLAQAAYGDDTSVDFSSLAAVDPNAIPDLIDGILSNDMGEILSNAPSMSLWLGHNPRATNIIKETYKFVSEPSDISVEKSLQMMNTFASFSSGYMNLSKSYRELMVQEYDRRYNSSGGITDEAITTPEKFAALLGFGSVQEAYNRETKSRVYLASKEAREDIKQLYSMQKQVAAKKGVFVDDPRWGQEMLRSFFAAGDFSLAAKDEYLRLMRRDARNQGDGVMGLILRNTTLIENEKLREAAYGSGYQQQLESTLRMIDEVSKEQLGEN